MAGQLEELMNGGEVEIKVEVEHRPLRPNAPAATGVLRHHGIFHNRSCQNAEIQSVGQFGR